MIPPRPSAEAALPGLFSQGFELDPNPTKFGFFRETRLDEHGVHELRSRMHKDGYLFCRGFWQRAEVQAVRDSITCQLEKLDFLQPGFPADEARARPSREVGRAFGNPLEQENPVLRRLVFGDDIMSFFTEFLGGTSRHLDYIWFRTKNPGIGSPLHCDLVYMGRGTPQLYTAWIPLGDIDLKLGGLLALEGSHRQGERLKGYLTRDVNEHCLNQPEAGNPSPEPSRWDGTLSKNPAALQESLGGRWLTAQEFQMGDAFFFNMTLVHGSLDNQTDRIRLSTDTRYQLAADPVDERWVGAKPAGHAASMSRGRVC